MNRRLKMGIGIALSVAAAIGIVLLWNTYMVRRPEATRIYRFGATDTSDYLGARRFLEHQGIAVEFGQGLRRTIPRLGPNEAMLVTYDASRLLTGLVDSLETWIAGGSTLLIPAPWQVDSTSDTLFLRLGVASAVAPDDEDEDDEDGPDALTDSVDSSSIATDPPIPGEEVFGERSPDEAGTSVADSTPDPESGSTCSDSTDSVRVRAPPPDTGIPLALPGRLDTLRITGRSYYEHGIYYQPGPLCRGRLVWQDTLDSSLVATRLGLGKAYIHLDRHRFTNRNLRRHDHAELLLELLGQNPKPAKVWIVVAANAPDRIWWSRLWELGGAAAVLALLLVAAWIWNRSRRFGPLLPDPAPDHRPILEHVDASARWLWNTEGGPDALLESLRRSTRSAIAARHPGWVRLPDSELCQELSRHHGISARRILDALGSGGARAPGPATPQEFVRTVKLLQKLKEHP